MTAWLNNEDLLLCPGSDPINNNNAKLDLSEEIFESIYINGSELTALGSKELEVSVDTASSTKFEFLSIGSNVNVILTAPNGDEITPDTVDSNKTFTAYQTEIGHTTVYSFSEGETGLWKIRLSASEDTFVISNVSLETSFTLDLEMSTLLAPQESTIISATLTGPDGGIVGATVTAEIDGEVILFSDEGNGTYQASLSLGEEGYFAIVATAIWSENEVSRQRQDDLFIQVGSPDAIAGLVFKTFLPIIR